MADHLCRCEQCGAIIEQGLKMREHSRFHLRKERQAKNMRTVCCKWLEKAFEAGQRCPEMSDQASEFYSPLFEHDWSRQMEKELAEAQAKGAET